MNKEVQTQGQQFAYLQSKYQAHNYEDLSVSSLLYLTLAQISSTQSSFETDR